MVDFDVLITSVTMQGGSKHTPMKSTTFGCLMAAMMLTYMPHASIDGQILAPFICRPGSQQDLSPQAASTGQAMQASDGNSMAKTTITCQSLYIDL